MKNLISIILLMLPLAVYTETLSIEQARYHALQNNANIRAVEELRMSSNDNRKAGFTDFLPSVQFIGNYLHINDKIKYEMDMGISDILEGMQYYDSQNPYVDLSQDQFFQTLLGMNEGGLLPDKLELQIGEKDNYLLSLVATQPVFTGGKLFNQYRIYKSLSSISESNEKLVSQNVIFGVDNLFCTAIKLREKADLASEYKTLVTAHVTDLESYLEEGLITENDLLKAQIALNEAELLEMKAVNGAKVAVMMLNQVIGYDLDKTWELETPPLITDTKFNSSVINREEIKIAEQNVAIAKSFKSIAFSRYLPNIIAYSDLHWTNPNPYNSLEEEFGRSWQIGVTAQMEIFHWNERGFENKSAQHKQKAAEYMLKDVSEKILVEIKKSKLELQEAWKRTEITTRSLQQSEENLRIVHEKFAEGLLKSSDLLDAQILWQKAHSDNIDARSDYNLSYYAYQKALGNRYYE